MTIYDRFKKAGFIGLLNETGITSENYKDILNKGKKMPAWKRFTELKKKTDGHPKDDKNYLVSWFDSDGKYSRPHMAYWMELDGHFFSLENNNSHPLHVDIFCEIPEIDLE